MTGINTSPEASYVAYILMTGINTSPRPLMLLILYMLLTLRIRLCTY